MKYLQKNSAVFRLTRLLIGTFVPIFCLPVSTAVGQIAYGTKSPAARTAAPVVGSSFGTDVRKPGGSNRHIVKRISTSPAGLPLPGAEVYFGQIKRVVGIAGPSVVHIEARKVSEDKSRAYTGTRGSAKPVEIDEAGSGVIFKHRGRYFVLTNRHVVTGASNQNTFIQLADGTFYYPFKKWEDAKTDLAVLAISAKKAPESKFGDSDKMTVGDFVTAIGSPFGLNHSVSYGIISATGRRNLDLGKSGVIYQDFFQTDAAINPGNSGGPLINLAGEVIAINAAIASNSGGNDGIGFAIPINMAKKVATDLIDYGKVKRSYLGVTLDSQYNARVAASLGLDTVYGARVLRVGYQTPAQSAGLQIGDVILRFNGQQVKNDSHLVLQVSRAIAGSSYKMEVFRSGRKLQLNVRLVENPNP